MRGKYQEPLTLHRYLYCLNDPVNRYDLDGRLPCATGNLAGALFSYTIGMNLAVRQYIETGDIVWSMDMETGEIVLAKVTETFQREAPEIVTVTVAGEGVETTTEHPFWVDGKGWTAAKDLSQSDKVVSYSGELLEVENISIVAAPTPVYNFEVEGTHTYYVSGANVLVHNANCGRAGSKKSRDPWGDLHDKLSKKELRKFQKWFEQQKAKARYGKPGGKKRPLEDVYEAFEDWLAEGCPNVSK